MTRLGLCLFSPFALAAVAAAQGPDLLLTYSQPERTLSGSAGTVLRFLYPNEVAHIEWSAPCTSIAGQSAEKWTPRTCFQTMAGDEDGDAQWWEPGLFGTVDALLDATTVSTAVYSANARTIFFSPSLAMGTGLSGLPGLRPGDVGRIVRKGIVLEGQVDYFMRQEHFNSALGLAAGTPIDVDAIAFAPNFGVFFSLDADTPALLSCGPTLVRDGAILCVPASAITYTPNMHVAAVLPNSAVVVYTEAQVDAMVVNAQLTDRNGNCLTNAIDTEALEIDRNGVVHVISPCVGTLLQVPDLMFTTETMTGAGVCTTAGGGSIYNAPCGRAARSCGTGPTLGSQMGVQPTSATLGVPSFINALTLTRTLRYAMEPQQHVVNVPPIGLPVGSQAVDLSSPWPINFIFWTPGASAANTATPSATNPFAVPLTFPDFYPFPTYWSFAVTAPSGFASWPMLPIPPGFVGNVVFQSLAFPPGGSWELSTPITVEFQ
jgi:hypothetical protein